MATKVSIPALIQALGGKENLAQAHSLRDSSACDHPRQEQDR